MTKENNVDEPLRYKSAKSIIGSMRDYILTNTDKLNDFTTGSALETLLEAIGEELEMYYYYESRNIDSGIANSIYDAFDVGRLPELKAYGQVIVNFRHTLHSPYVIPAGTYFSSSNEYYDQTYETLDAYRVPAGTSTIAVTVYCQQGGTYGNVPAGVINRADNLSSADVVVTNPTAFSTGQNQEPMSVVKVRFRNLIQALQRGTVQAVQYAAMEMPNVQGAFVDESVGYVRVYAHDANGTLPLPLQKAIQNNMIYWRPAGVPVEVFPTHRTIVDVGISLDVPNKLLRTQSLLDEVEKVITDYINGRRVSQDITVNDIVSRAMNINNVGIDNVQAVVKVLPDIQMVDGAAVNENNSITFNEHVFNKSILAPRDRAEFNDYVHNPADRDNPPYEHNDNGSKFNNDNDLTTHDSSDVNIDSDDSDDSGVDPDTDSDVKFPTSVTARDAPQNGSPLRVYNRYKTAGQEILRAGYVRVVFSHK